MMAQKFEIIKTNKYIDGTGYYGDKYLNTKI